MVRALQRAGWQIDRIHGSHHVLIHAGKPNVTIVVPVHNRPIKKGILADILSQATLSIREFRDLLLGARVETFLHSNPYSW
ncbi:MAG: type II toxin-antitoxin system HicA family toxin [Chloroflexi bacterium]|nr:type II toxin-antitoxin system HicA family toxin [Chloroflexota bacterium]